MESSTSNNGIRDEKPSDSFDVILLYEPNSGRDHKNKLLQFLCNAGLSVCNTDDGKLCSFPEIWTDRMASSSVVILLLSKDYSESDECKGRLEHAFQAGKKVFPVKIEKLELCEESTLGRFMSSVVSYKLYKDYDTNVKKLIGSVKEHLNKSEFRKEAGGKCKEREDMASTNQGCDPTDLRKNDKSKNWMPTINVFGGNVVIGNHSHMNVSSHSAPESHGAANQPGVKPKETHSVDKSGRSTDEHDIREVLNDRPVLMDIADLLEQGNGDSLKELALVFDLVEPSKLESVAPSRSFFENLVCNKGDIKLSDLKKLIEEDLRFHNRKVFRCIQEDIEKGNVKLTFEITLGELFGNGINKLYFLENVADKLLRNSFQLPSWEDVADHYGYDYNEIQRFEANVKEERPTVKLLRHLSFMEDVPTITVLKSHLKSLNRNDIVRILDERFH